MESIRSHFFRRGVCLACAAVLLLTIVTPAARAAGPEDAASETQQLTYADAAGMAEADRAIAALTGSADYGALDAAGRADAAGALLESLADGGLVQPGSLCLDAENRMYSFTYDCGVLGGILLADPDDEAGIDAGPIDAAGIPAALADPIGAENDVLPVGNAIVYYAFDDTTNSNRWPYYTIMQEYWNEWGLATTIDSEVTVADLRHMDDYDLCVLSAHGAYYSYNAGWLFRRVKTAPIVILQEESSFWDDLRYGIDLLTHRVIKVSGRYCVTPDFFRAAYRGGKLNGNIIFSETCEFFGGGNMVDLAMSTALLDGGARAVVGFVNTVYAIYARNMLWGTVNQLITGQNILQAVDAAAATYGVDDIAWYLSQGGATPHRYAAFALIHGDDTAALYTLPAADAPAAA